MKSVYKYILDTRTDNPIINLPIGTEILYAREQYDNVCVWALVDKNEGLTYPVMFRVAGTGHPIDDDISKYIGSAHLDGGSLIIHVFLLHP